MRILMLLASFDTGGAERSALELAAAMRRGGHYLSAGAVRKGGPLREVFEEAFDRVHDGLARGRFDPLAAFRIRRILADERIDVLIVVDVARNAMFYGFVAAAGRKCRIARVCWCKSIPGGQAGRFAGLLRWLVRLGMVDAVVCTSERQRRLLAEHGIDRRQIALVHNGIDLDRFGEVRPADLSVQPGKKLIVQVANVMPDKDHATLLVAAGRLREQRDDFHLALLGRGTDSPEMAEMARGHGLAGSISLLGCRQDVAEVLAAADIFVLCSSSEVFPVAVLEAMAAGLPVVLSDLPAYEEMLARPAEGLVVPAGDPEALAACLAKLLDDRELRVRLGEAARQRSGEFGVDRMAKGFGRALNRLGHY